MKPADSLRRGKVAVAALTFGLLTNACLNLVANIGLMLRRPSGTRCIAQALDAVYGKGLSPFPDSDRRDLQRGGDLLVVRTAGSSQNNAAA